MFPHSHLSNVVISFITFVIYCCSYLKCCHIYLLTRQKETENIIILALIKQKRHRLFLARPQSNPKTHSKRNPLANLNADRPADGWRMEGEADSASAKAADSSQDCHGNVDCDGDMEWNWASNGRWSAKWNGDLESRLGCVTCRQRFPRNWCQFFQSALSNCHCQNAKCITTTEQREQGPEHT